MSSTTSTTSATRQEPLSPTGVLASFRFAFSSPRRFRTEVLAGLVVALALIPESIAFSVLAGVDPKMGLFASCTMAMTIALTGGRPAMISAATGAVALVIAPVVRDHGVEYFLATVILAGIIQIALSLLGVAKLMRFIPRSVMLGFVNALACLVFFAQLPHLIDVPWMVYPLFALGIGIMLFWPKLTSVIPAPLIVIVALTAIVWVFGINIPNVSDQGELPSSLPEFLIPNVPLTLETLKIIGPYALGMSLVGLMESLLTAKLVDDITEVHSNKSREAAGQGIANIITAFLGGMGGCAMIGQTMINVKNSGARTRLSTFLAGGFLLLLVVLLGDVVGKIPMAALVAVMIIVSIDTADWHSLNPRTLKFMPLSETIVMFITIIATLATGNLAIGVILGVLTAMVMFARRVAHLVSVERTTDNNISTYTVKGQLFWASSNDMVYSFDYSDEAEQIIIDLTAAEIWDASTVATLDSIIHKYAARGKSVEIIGLDGSSRDRLERLSGKLG
ncbi:SulP family inorganic anion transporter [Corynebacterium glutamicum]|uniref:SulP family inorganic anion transporter n=1 Tax=Corynebacterium glutamicum TaxID=1718 RepID=UPI0009BEBD08|nr:SulP family inorganic anion transporter [Corynebacterium glutamicum]